MKKFILISVSVLTISLFCSYVSFVQVVFVESDILIEENGFLVFENSDVKVEYDLWSENGVLRFSIYNKTRKPIYIDWKKSSFIDNGVRLSYWEDKVVTSTDVNLSTNSFGLSKYSAFTPGVQASFSYSKTTGKLTSESVQSQRISFIPPNSKMRNVKFRVHPDSKVQITPYETKKEALLNNKRLSTSIKLRYFESDNSPLIFRNFLTYSFQESFINELYVDNKFFISKVIEMSEEHFHSYVYESNNRIILRDEEGNYMTKSPYEKGSCFYLVLDKRTRTK